MVLPEHPFPEISHGEVATAMIGLICVGKPDFDAIEPFRNDSFFAQSLGLARVSSSQPDPQAVSSTSGVFSDIILPMLITEACLLQAGLPTSCCYIEEETPQNER